MGEITELSEMIRTFCELRDWDQFNDPKELAIGISTEANELLQMFRFKREQDMIQMFENAGTRKKIEDEVADIFYFLLRFAQMNHIDLNQSLKRKWMKMKRNIQLKRQKGKIANIVNCERKFCSLFICFIMLFLYQTGGLQCTN